MSDKLVVEFYQEDSPSSAQFAVMSLHGGDNPVTASLTIADFIAHSRGFSSAQKPCDSYGLASRFIIWNAVRYPDAPTPEAELIEVSERYGYQTARIFSSGEQIRVELVRDEFTIEAEIMEGTRFLQPLCPVSAA